MPAGRMGTAGQASGAEPTNPHNPLSHWLAHPLTNLLLLVLGLEANNLQVAAAGDVGHDSSDAAPHAQQRPAQHVVVPQPQALHAVLAFPHQPALPVPGRQAGRAAQTLGALHTCP